MKIKHVIAISVVVFALLAGAFLGIASFASAQGSTSIADPSVSAHRGGGESLENVAEILGIAVEDLQEALKNSRPAECTDLERGEKPKGVDCRPDLESVASTLGITVEKLESAFQSAREEAQAERLASAAEQLGVSVEALQSALENARPAECADLEPGERPSDGVNCRADLDAVADELGVTVEELQSTLGRGGRGQGLENVAEALGVTTEELQQALQESRPAECADLERGKKSEGVDCRSNLETAAEVLGVDVEELKTALQNERGGQRGPGHHGPNGEGGQP